jgi:hypothetical protein
MVDVVRLSNVFAGADNNLLAASGNAMAIAGSGEFVAILVTDPAIIRTLGSCGSQVHFACDVVLVSVHPDKTKHIR